MSIIGGMTGGLVGGELGGLSTPTPPPTYPVFLVPTYCDVREAAPAADVSAPFIPRPYTSQVQDIPMVHSHSCAIQDVSLAATVQEAEAKQ